MEETCLTADNMLELLTAEKLDDSNRVRLFQFNAHLMRCAPCNEPYRKLAALYDIVEDWSIPSHHETEMKLRHLKGCLALIKAQKAASPSLAARIEAWLKNYVESSAQVLVKVGDGIKMAAEEAGIFVADSSRMLFGYAGLAAARSDDAPPKVDINLLLDENNALNRIKIEEGRKIKITLDDAADTAPLVALIPYEKDTPAIFAELSYNEQDELWTAEIEDLPDGEYDLVIESVEE